MNKTEETKVYDVVKVITTILVVLAHVTTMYTENGAIETFNNSDILSALTAYIYQFHMPLFVLVSGCVYGYCISAGKYNHRIAFLYGKAKRLLIPYLAFGLFYVAPVMQLLKIDTQGYLKYCIKGIIFSLNSRHLWYILALFWIFVLAMLVKPLLQSGIKGGMIVGVLSLGIFVLVHQATPYFQIHQALHYQLYFFAGIGFHYCYEFFDEMFSKHALIFGICPFLLLFSFFWNPNWITNLIYQFIGILMILVLGHWIVSHKSRLMDSKLYVMLKKNAFGIYLFHPMIIYVLFYIFGGADVNPLLLSSMIFVIAMVLSVLATNIIRKINLGILIGE